MTHRIATIADILHPISEKEFFAEYLGRKPLYVPASDPEKFASVMSWPTLSNLLNMSMIWNPTNLQLYLDRKKVLPADYCREEIDRDARPSMQPDPERVKDWMRRGASLVANYLEALTPELAAATTAIERPLEGKAQANLYCSWQQHRAFHTHMDTHDVFVLHITGEKDWNIYEGRLDNPIANETFKALDDDFSDKNCGKVAMKLTLRPGDFLYLPRGQYHDAMASTEACIHLTIGVSRIIGHDMLDILFKRAIDESPFRGDFPVPTGEPAKDRAAYRAHITKLTKALTDITSSEQFLDNMTTFRENFKCTRGGFDMPGDVIASGKEKIEFALTSDDFAIVNSDGRNSLKGPKGATPIPANIESAVCWVVERRRFTRAELAAAFPAMSEASREKFLGDLSSMRVIGPA